ncbi:hypothetical protein Psfp_02352 [Pelotomaculum sp. FP]|nr:hypothetical protein Psfp_02352 [Pelotomaculum sp. FP]
MFYKSTHGHFHGLTAACRQIFHWISTQLQVVPMRVINPHHHMLLVVETDVF